MKKLIVLSSVLCTLGIAAPSAHAAKVKKNKGGEDVFAQFDKNSDGKLDDKEKEAVQKAFKDGNEAVKKYDFNGDGKLDDGELAAIQPAAKKKKKNK
ncbi:MAG TPA: hypothetical protein VI454_11385 [Verrucomicrobiae bacterium]|jgi:Ca2+-binding EF-hand superfamily protein